MVSGYNLASLIIEGIEWPQEWPKNVKKDFEVWIKNSIGNSHFQHNKKLNEILDDLLNYTSVTEE